jgi:drug/metabolite transporter (DMT)-like permease
MSWFFITLIGPFLYALTNHIDKILLEKYFKVSGVGTLLLFSSLLSILILPILYFLDPAVVDVNIKSAIALAVVSTLNILVLLFYFLALRDDEASIAIVFYQLVPVFGYILGYFVLGENLTQMQLIAMVIIILGTSIISVEIDNENNFKLRGRTIILMTLASLFWALGSVIFKYVALEENVVRSLFWENLTLVVIGIGIFIFIKTYREHFLLALKENSKAIISLNVLNESLYMLGNVVYAFAYMLAPIALILLTQSFQSIFVLLIGIFLTVFFPKIAVEKIEVKYILQKLIAILITGVGTYILLVF